MNEYCEHYNGNVLCPICRSNINYSCMDVWAFKAKALGKPNSKLFNDEHIQNIYDSQKGGMKRKNKTKKIYKNKRNKRNKKNNKIRTYRKKF